MGRGLICGGLIREGSLNVCGGAYKWGGGLYVRGT